MATIFSDPHVSSFGHRRESGWSGMIYPSVNSRFLFPIISCLCPKIESMRTCSSIQVGQPRVDCFVFLKMDVAFTFLQLLVLCPELHNNLSKTTESSLKGCWPYFQYLGWSLLGLKDLYGSNHSAVGLYFHCSTSLPHKYAICKV